MHSSWSSSWLSSRSRQPRPCKLLTRLASHLLLPAQLPCGNEAFGASCKTLGALLFLYSGVMHCQKYWAGKANTLCESESAQKHMAGTPCRCRHGSTYNRRDVIDYSVTTDVCGDVQTQPETLPWLCPTVAVVCHICLLYTLSFLHVKGICSLSHPSS